LTENLENKAITPEKLVNALIAGLKKDQFTIRVGISKLVYMMSRLAPKIAYSLVNPANNSKELR
jgi:uncharacterized oxidoreductase